MYCSKDFKGMKPTSGRTIDLFFLTEKGRETVTLSITNGMHAIVMKAISNAIVSGNQAVIVIADIDNNRFINNNIHDVKIKNGVGLAQKITGTSKTAVVDTGGNDIAHSPSSITLTSVHDSAAAVGSLWLTDITGLDISATDVVAAETEAATRESLTLTVDNGSGSASDASDNEILDERLFKSDGTFFGVCSNVASTTALNFLSLDNQITNNDVLYVGNRYYILEDVTFPLGTTLKLTADEIGFSTYQYRMFIQLSAGAIDLMVRY